MIQYPINLFSKLQHERECNFYKTYKFRNPTKNDEQLKKQKIVNILEIFKTPFKMSKINSTNGNYPKHDFLPPSLQTV